MEVVSVLLACLPSAVVGFGVWLIQRSINKSDKKRTTEEQARQEEAEKREELRKKQEAFLVESVDATFKLAKATAGAVQRIPDAHCNGDMHAALDYANSVTRKHRQFLEQQGIAQIYD
jgi:hypothetical protein